MQSKIYFKYEPNGNLVQQETKTDKIYQGQVGTVEYRIEMAEPDNVDNWRPADSVFIVLKRPDGEISQRVMRYRGGGWELTSNGWETDVIVAESGSPLTISFVMRRYSTMSAGRVVAEKTTAQAIVQILPSAGFTPLNIANDIADDILQTVAEIEEELPLKADKTYVDMTFIPKSDKGIAGGVANLDSAGKVPFEQLPDKLLGKTLDDFSVDDDTGLGIKYYSDGSTAEIQFPTGGTGNNSGGEMLEFTFLKSSWVNGEIGFPPLVTGQKNNRYIASIEKKQSGGYEQLSHKVFKGSDGSILLYSGVPFDGRVIISKSTGGGGGSIDEEDLAGFMKNPSYDPITHVLSFDIVGAGKYYIDLPIEQLVMGLAVDGTDLVLTLQDGTQTRVPMNALLNGMASEQWVSGNYVSKASYAQTSAIKSGFETAGESVRHYTYTDDTDPKTVKTYVEIISGMPPVEISIPTAVSLMLSSPVNPSFFTLDLYNKLKQSKVYSILQFAEGSAYQISGISYDVSEEDKLVVSGYYQSKSDFYYVTVTLVKSGNDIISEYELNKAGSGSGGGDGGGAAKTILFGADKFQSGIAYFSPAETGQINDKYQVVAEVVSDDGAFATSAHAVYKSADGGAIVHASVPFSGRLLIGGSGGGSGSSGGSGLIKSGRTSIHMEDMDIGVLYEYTGEIDPKETLIWYDVGADLPYAVPLPIALWLFLGGESLDIRTGDEVNYELISALKHYNILSLRADGFFWNNIFDLSFSTVENMFFISAVLRVIAGEIEQDDIVSSLLMFELDDDEETAMVEHAVIKSLGGGSSGESSSLFESEGYADLPDIGSALVSNKHKKEALTDFDAGDFILSGRVAPLMLVFLDDNVPTQLVDIIFENAVKSMFISVNMGGREYINFGCDDISYSKNSQGQRSITLAGTTVPDDDLYLYTIKILLSDNYDGTTAVLTDMIGGNGGGGSSGSADGWNILDWRTNSKYWDLVASRGGYGRAFQLELISYYQDAYVKLAIDMRSPNDYGEWGVRVVEAHNASGLGNSLKIGKVFRGEQGVWDIPAITLYTEDVSLNNIGIGWRVSTPQELDILNREGGGIADELIAISTISNTN